jgi:hypothetical protein
MIVFGLLLLGLATLLEISFLRGTGLIFVIIGAFLSIAGYVGHPVGGRRYWY